MGPEGGGPGPAAGPGLGDGPEFAFEQGSDPDEMAGLEEPGMDSGEDLRAGPAFGGAPGSVRGPGPFGPRPGGPDFGITAAPPGEALQAFLGLNDEQVRSLRRLQRERAGKLDEARLQLHRRQGALLDLLEQEEPDGNALVSTVKSIHALRKQAREIEKEFREKTAAVLNEDQQTRLKSIQDANQIPRAMREAARLDLIRPTEMVPGGYVPR
jgi:hypothetical protein